jgi:hypothetical protein
MESGRRVKREGEDSERRSKGERTKREKRREEE